MISGNMFLEFQFFLHYFKHVSLWGKVILIFKRHISMEFHKFVCAELLVLMIMKQTLNILSESFAEIWFINSSVHRLISNFGAYFTVYRDFEGFCVVTFELLLLSKAQTQDQSDFCFGQDMTNSLAIGSHFVNKVLLVVQWWSKVYTNMYVIFYIDNFAIKTNTYPALVLNIVYNFIQIL